MATYLKNNFDFLRLLFASLVIVSHSYPLTRKDEYFSVITNGQLGLGGFSVHCFFIMSGYLIFISLKTSKNVITYLWKRVLRIFPALFGLLIVTAIILSLVTNNPTFFLTKDFAKYALNVLSLFNVSYRINDIFIKNPYPYAINGSLWSLAYEFLMYVLFMLLFFIRKSKATLYILIIAFLISSFLSINEITFLKGTFKRINIDTSQLYVLLTYFLGGSLMTYIDLKKINTIWLRIVLFTLLVFSIIINMFNIVSIFLLPFFIICVATISTPYLNSIAKKTGDLSYGIYIYGFLVQQSVMHFFKLDTWILTLVSLIISSLFAYCSWHLIEKKMLKFKNIL